MNKLKIAMLSTGDEILHGDIHDTNASWLASNLFEAGYSLTKRVTLGDEFVDISNEIQGLSQHFDIVIVNGGLGPTSDDLTTESMANAMQVKLELNSIWLEKMQSYFERNGRNMPQSNIKQAMLPKGATMIDNPIGTACGFSAKLNKCVFYFTPGVPKEFKLMLSNEILPDIKKKFKDENKICIQRFFTFGLSESVLNDELNKISLSEHCKLGYRSELPFIEIKLFAPEKINIDKEINEIKNVLAGYFIGHEQPMLSRLSANLTQNHKSLSVCEKYTSGYLTYLINQLTLPYQPLVKSSILPIETKEIDSHQQALDSVLSLASVERMTTNTEISLVCNAYHENIIAIAMSTETENYACLIQIAKRWTVEENRKLVSTFMLDLLRRYLAKIEVFSALSSIQILESKISKN